MDELTAFRGHGSEWLRWWLMLVFLILCALGGGSNRIDVLSLLFLRPAALVSITALVLMNARPGRLMSRVPLVLLSLYSGQVALQLVPLPPIIWLHLPGHALFAEATDAVGLPRPWRPLTLTPSRTWSSLIATSVGFAVLLGMSKLRGDQMRALIGLLLVIVLVSGLLGIAQIASGTTGGLQLYRETIEGQGVGLFANRNHQAAMLATGLVLMRAWFLLHSDIFRSRWIATGAMGAGTLLILLLIVTTGSRAGLAVGVLGALGALLIAPLRDRAPGAGRAFDRLLQIGIVAGSLLLLAFAIFLGRAESYNRIFEQDYNTEQRLLYLPAMVQMFWTYFPFGSGYGSFDRVFMMFEPDALLRPTYFNHAHDDYLEVAITGGVLGIAILAAAILWAGWTTWQAFRSPLSRDVILARTAGVVLTVFAVASTVDYPARTPLIGAISAIAFGFLARSATASASRQGVSLIARNPKPD